MGTTIDSRLFAALGIPVDYGTNPPLPSYAEAGKLQDAGPNIIGRRQKLAPGTAVAWRNMQGAARRDGVVLMLVSGFRSIGYQTELIRRKLAAGETIEAILKVNVAPGFSQHHTGKAIDVATPGCRPLTEEFERSDAFAWLQKRAAIFEFGMPYCRSNAFGLSYEPWHWSQLPL